ncbi:MAG TPA: helix-turn-helix domain-containing protein [Candidatus Dormibacteraeota bacterium]|jgi:AraC-like DNA-binding protein
MGVYRELEPSPALREHLACVWYQTVGPDEPALLQRVLPDACIDLVWEARDVPRIAGPDTGPMLAPLAPGALLVGARFRPGRGPDVLGVAATELRDGQPELAAVWGDAASRRLRESDATGSLPAMLALIQREVEARLAGARPVDPCAPAAVAWARGRSELPRLGADLGLGERQLRRRVEERFGYGPAVLRRVLRLQRLLSLMARHPSSLSELALAAGYADQAHMTRECQRLAGLSPARLLAERLPTAP